MNDNVKCPKCGSDAWDWANIGFSEAKQCTDCGEIYMMIKDKKPMKTYDVYVEDFNGNFFDEYTIEAESIDKAYDKAYERLNWAAMEVHIEESSTALQDAFFDGKNPLDSFPSIKGESK
jgi:hypothetical protein